MSTEDGNVTVPPFIEDTVQEKSPSHVRSLYSERSLLSQATMFVGFVALTLAMVGGAWLIWKVLGTGLMNNLEMALAGIIPVGLAYMVGWILSIVCIRAYNNLVFPLLVRYYSWFTLTGVVVLYIKVMQKLFTQAYQMPNFIAYNIILLGILLALFGLHLLPEDHNLRPYAFPLFLAGLLHLWLMIVRYVLLPVEVGKGFFILGDLWIFLLMQTIAGLMLVHNGIFNPLRESIADFFRERGKRFR